MCKYQFFSESGLINAIPMAENGNTDYTFINCYVSTNHLCASGGYFKFTHYNGI